MKFILNKDKLTVENEESSNSGSVQYYEVEVEHDDSWDDLTIEAVIVPKEGGTLIFDEVESIAEIDNKIYIDRELSGSYAIGFKGYTIENEVKVYQISTNLQGVYFETGAGQIITTNSIPKPTEWEIYVAQIEAIANRASQSADDAQTSAESAETSAENAQTSAETATEQAETATEQAEEATRQAESAKNDADRAEQAREGFETEVENATRDFNTNATNKTNSFDENADTKTTEYNTNHTNKLKDYNDNATEKFGAYNTNHTNKLKTYNDNHTEKLGNYNTNDTNKTKDYNDNATEKTNAFNTNATNKTDTFNDNATNKTTAFNDNATQKTNDFNTNASDKTTEFNEVVDTAKDDIEEIAPMLQEKMGKIETFLQPATATGTSIHTEDSADWYGKLNFEGFSRQETTTGKNKLNPNNPTSTSSASVTYNNDIITVSSNTTSTVPYVRWVFDVQEGDIIRLNGIIKNSNGRIVRQTYNGSWGGYTEQNYVDGASISSLEYTVPSGVTQVRFNLYAHNDIPSEAISSNYENVIVTINNSDMTYEQYTGGIPQPNINYPSEIRNLEGKNLFNINEVVNRADANNTMTITNGVLNMKAISTTGAQFAQAFVKDLDSNKFYVLSFKAKKIVKGTDGMPRIVIRVYGSNDDETYSMLQEVGISSVNTVEGQEYILSTGKYTGYKHYRFYIYNNAQTPVTVGEETEYWDIQFEEGAVVTPYAPKDNLRIKEKGFNIWDERWELGYYGSSGTAISDNNSIRSNTNDPIYIDPNLNYYVKCPDTTKCYICQYKEDGTFINRADRANSIFTPDANTAYIKFNLQSTYGNIYNNDICINVSNPVRNGEYEPYKEHNIDFPLGTEKMYQGSTLTDNGIKHIRKQWILDGTENFVTYPNGDTENYFAYRSPLLSDLKLPATQITLDNALCSHLKQQTWAQMKNKREEQGFAVRNDSAYIYFKTTHATVEAWQAYLAQQYANGTPVTIEYELDEPEIVPYTQAQQDAHDETQNLETYQYVNNIDLIANEETNMTLDYKKDIQMQIAEQDTEIENIKSRLDLLE